MTLERDVVARSLAAFALLLLGLAAKRQVPGVLRFVHLTFCCVHRLCGLALLGAGRR